MHKAKLFLFIFILVILHLSLSSGINVHNGDNQPKPATKSLTVPISEKDNLLNPRSKWKVWDNPKARNYPSQWNIRLTELSGIRSEPNQVSSMLLTGKKSWRNYSLEASVIRYGDSGDEGMMFGFVFGYQDSEHFYWVGYDSDKERFQLEARIPEGLNTLDYAEMEFPKYEEIPFRVDFVGSRILFSLKDNVLFDLDDGRYLNGQCGLAVAGLGSEKILIGEIKVQSIEPGTLAVRPLQDLLSFKKGAKLVSPANEMFLGLIDHETSLDTKKMDPKGMLLINLKEEKLPLEAVFSSPNNQEAEVHKIGIQVSDMWLPGSVEFLVSPESPQNGFQSLGTFQIKPRKNGYQEFEIKPVSGKYLKIRILSPGPTGLDPSLESQMLEQTGRMIFIEEILVYGYLKGATSASRTQEGSEKGEDLQDISVVEDYKSGNLDNWQVWDDPQATPPKSRWGIVLTEFAGISSDHTTEEPATMLLNGDQEWENYTFRVRVYPTTTKGSLGKYMGLVFGYQDPDHFFRVGYNKSENRYELEAFTPQGFELLSFAEMEIPENKIGKFMDVEIQSIPNRIIFMVDDKVIFDIEDGRYSKGKLGIEASGISPLERGAYLFKDLRVTPIDPEHPPTRQLQDLLSHRRGAAVIYRSSPPVGDQFQSILDHSLTQKDYRESTYSIDLSETSLPEEAVFCFPQGRFAEIHKIGIQLTEEYFPKEIRFSVSNETPKSGFKPLITIKPKPKAESYQEFPVSPTIAKYLKIQVTESYSSEEIEISEIFVKGYFKEIGGVKGVEETLGEVQLKEIESNNAIQEAQNLPLDTLLGGEVSQKDTDYYHIALNNIKDEMLKISIRKIGFTTPKLDLQSREGTSVSPSDIQISGETHVFTYRLKPDDYYLKIIQPEIYVMIVYDDSGSMKVSVPVVKRVLRGYLDNLKEGLLLGLMKYTDKVFDLSDFTRDPSRLKAAAESEVIGAGNTDTFTGLVSAIDRVKIKDGNRVIIAILDDLVSQRKTAEWLQDYIELWDTILDTEVIISTIGVQTGWHKKSDYFANTYQQIFSEFAYATGGQFYLSPSDEMIKQSASTLFEQFTSPVQYHLKAELKKETKPKPKPKPEVKKKVKKQGTFQILFEEGAEKETTKKVELILDASNSMWGQIKGESKISIARTVLDQIISELPEKMNVGLRVYGHRYPLRDKRACQDTELMVPIGPLAKKQMIDIINQIKPKGKTPLVFSVLQAAEDFKNIDKGTIILISDGIESCGGDIDNVAPALKELGLDLKLYIVGFGIKEANARQELETIASSTKGKYLEAKDSQELLSSLEETLRVEYVILDEKGDVKASGFVGGEPAEVMEGTYTLRLLVEPHPLETKVVIKAEGEHRYFLKKEQEEWVIQEKIND